MKKQAKPPATKKKRKRSSGLIFWEKMMIASTVLLAGTFVATEYVQQQMEEMEESINQDDLDGTCLRVGEPILIPSDSLMTSFNKNLSDIFNSMQNSPLGKHLYDLADEDDLRVCYQDDRAEKLNANAFLDLNNPHMGYSLDMITSSTHSGVETTAHEFYHYYQLKNAREWLIGYTSDTFADDILSTLVSEAAAATVGTIVLHELDMSPDEKVWKFRLTDSDRYHLDKFQEFLEKYSDESQEDALLHAAQDVMTHRLTGDILYDSWRNAYSKRVLDDEETEDLTELEVFEKLLDDLQNKTRIRNASVSGLRQLTALPDGRNIMPENIVLKDILRAAENSVKEKVERLSLNPPEPKKTEETPTPEAKTKPTPNNNAGVGVKIRMSR